MSKEQTIRHNTWLRIFIWIPVIIMVFGIFGFSSQNGNESGGLSQKASIMIIQAADQLHIIDVNQDNQEYFVSCIEYPLRKCAHMAEYAVLCSLIYLAFSVDGIRRTASRYLAFCCAVAFACTDEIHQLFVPERSGRFSDVLVDSTGCLIGLLVCYLIFKIRINMKNRKK